MRSKNPPFMIPPTFCHVRVKFNNLGFIDEGENWNVFENFTLVEGDGRKPQL